MTNAGWSKFFRYQQHFIVAITVAFLPLLNTLAQTCTDPDGENSFIKGVTRFVHEASKQEYPATDYCTADGKKVVEHYCPSVTQVWNMKNISCPEKCVDGRCINTPRCTDTDPSDDPLIAGKTVWNNENGTSTPLANDSCSIDGGSLVQASCGIARNFVTTKVFCRPGCLDGRCSPPKEKIDGCYWRIDSAITAGKSGRALSAATINSVVGKYALQMLSPTNTAPGRRALIVETIDSAGKIVNRYNETPSFAIRAEGTPLLAGSVTNRNYIPFDREVKSIRVTYKGVVKEKVLTAVQKMCVRPCVTFLEAGNIKRGDKCCLGIQKPISSTAFVCLDTPSPTPSASPKAAAR